jgi:hypothetical protein
MGSRESSTPIDPGACHPTHRLDPEFMSTAKGNAMSVQSSKSLSRRTVLIAAASAAPLLAMGSAKAAGLPPAAVSYQPTPKDGHQCSDCKLFVEPRSCKSVTGDIAPEGWCKLWAKKA